MISKLWINATVNSAAAVSNNPDEVVLNPESSGMFCRFNCLGDLTHAKTHTGGKDIYSLNIR